MGVNDDDERRARGELNDPCDGTVPADEIGKSDLAKRWRPVGEALREKHGENGALNKYPPKRDWLLKKGEEGIFPLGKCGALGAGGGTGKTAALCQLAVSVALQIPWFGFNIPKAGKVVLALGEEDLDEVWRRLYKIADREELCNEDRKRLEDQIIALPLAGCPIAFVDKNSVETDHLKEFRKLLASTQDVRLVILDPLSRFAGMETETDNAAATRFVQAVESLAKESGAAIMVAAHSSKASQENGTPNFRGASAITDGIRWAATMTREGRYVKLSQFKTNYSKPFDDIYLGWAVDSDKQVTGVLEIAKYIAEDGKGCTCKLKIRPRKGAKYCDQCGGELRPDWAGDAPNDNNEGPLSQTSDQKDFEGMFGST